MIPSCRRNPIEICFFKGNVFHSGGRTAGLRIHTYICMRDYPFQTALLLLIELCFWVINVRAVARAFRILGKWAA